MAQHTLELCPAWELPRYTLRLAIGECLAPSVVVEAMLNGPQVYEAALLFCEQVMLVKERTEREREKSSHPCRVTRRGGMAVRRPRAASPSFQRVATGRGDGARSNAPLAPNLKVKRIFAIDSNESTREGLQRKDNSIDVSGALLTHA